MIIDPAANFAYSTVATAPSPATSGTSVVLASGEGARFPDPASVGPYNIVIWQTSVQPISTNAEIVRVTAKSTDTLTITREQESTSARTVVVGDQVSMNISALFRDNLNTHLNNISSAGLISGGAVTDGGSETVDVAEAVVLIRATDSDTGKLYRLTLAASAGEAIATNTIRYVGVEFAGTEFAPTAPQVVVKDTDSWNEHTEFPLAVVVNEGGTLHISCNPQKVVNVGGHILHRLYETHPRQRADRLGGLILGETGTRYVTVSAGEFYDRVNEFAVSAIDTTPTADTFDSYSSNGSESTGDTQWDNDNYDNAGTLTSLSNNKYAVLWFYLELDGGLICIYGTAQHSTLGAAENESPPTTLPNRVTATGVLIGRVLFQKGDSSAQSIESVFETTFAPTGVTLHNSMGSMDGGTSGEYFHLTSAQHTAVIDDGWMPAGETWTYASAPTFTISGDLTAKYFKGVKIKMTNTTTKYFYVISSSFGGGNTTVTVVVNTTAVIANAAITAPFISNIETPQGFPDWINFTCRVTKTADQQLTTGVAATMAWDSEDSDDNGMHDNSSNNSRINLLISGRYALFYTIRFDTNATGRRFAQPNVDGGPLNEGSIIVPAASSASTRLTGYMEYDFVSGSYLELNCVQASGGNLNVDLNSTFGVSMQSL